MKGSETKPEQLAAELSVSLSTLYRFFGGRAEPTFAQVVTASKFFDKPLEWFAGEAA